MEIETAKLALPVIRGRDHIQGPDTAPVTLVEYGDYECPFCGKAYYRVKEVQELLGDNLRFVFRNFPLTQIHPNAQNAAEAAESAGAQNMFWEMHDCMFEHQQALYVEHLMQYATMLGLDLPRFVYDLSNHVYAPRVREDFRSGVRSGVNGTPTFYVNGIRYNDSWDLEPLLENLRSTINEVLQ
jgi:protein-disulfide isomerase